MIAARGRVILVVLAMSASIVAQSAAERPGRYVSFVACPEFRNTVRQCWLAQYQGKTYYIGAFGIGTPPQLLHQVLVEGIAHDDEMSCGAVNIEPVHVSPLPEITDACNTVLPNNGAAPREGSLFDLPPAVLARNGSDVPSPPPLRANTVFTVGFDFDRAILNLANQARVEMAARAIMGSPVKRVIVSGREGQSRLSDGTVMTEVPGIAAKRIAAVGNALIAIGVRPDKVEMRQAGIAASTDPTQGVESRDVAIEVVLTPSRTGS
jgi:hypothetical protein